MKTIHLKFPLVIPNYSNLNQLCTIMSSGLSLSRYLTLEFVFVRKCICIINQFPLDSLCVSWEIFIFSACSHPLPSSPHDYLTVEQPQLKDENLLLRQEPLGPSNYKKRNFQELSTSKIFSMRGGEKSLILLKYI